jgi:hypothetical protein
MKNSIVRRINASTPMVLLLLMLMLLTMHRPALATLYTYTSPILANSLGLPFPSPPAIGDSLTIQFTYNGAIPADPTGSTDLSPTIPFTMTCGAVTLSSSTGGMPTSLYIFSVTPGGLPSAWYISINMPYLIGASSDYSMLSAFYTGPMPTPVPHAIDIDSVEFNYEPPLSGLCWLWQENRTHPGVWTASPVPVPTTMLLLGSGLIPLAWVRRKNRLGK